MIEKHRNVSWRNKKRPFRKSVLCHPGYCGLKWGRGRAFKIETIKVGREAPAPLKGRVFKIKENSLRVFDQVAWRLRHRYKERCANMQRRPEAKHCSSLCSQSEGDEYCGGQTRLKIQRRYALKRWLYSLRVRGPHFASKVSYNAGVATDDYVGQCKTPLRGRPLSRFIHSTTVALRRKISLRGRSEVSVLTLCMALTTSRPMVTSPNTVYCPSSQGVPPFLP